MAGTFITEEQENELMNLWHLSRVPLSGQNPTRYKRMIWASGEFAKAHPEVSSTAAYKSLERILARWF